MKVLLEVEVTGDFEEPLTNDGIIYILTAVIVDCAQIEGLNASYRINKMIIE